MAPSRTASASRPAVLVVGGAGYIGAHTAKALDAAGFAVCVADDLSAGHKEFLRWGEFVRLDIRDRAAVAELFAARRFAGVLHFASRIQVAESMADPMLHYDTNVAGSLNLVDAARLHGVGAFIFSSSAAVYGAPETMPLAENQLLEPLSPYGRSKLMVEQVLADAHAAYGLASVSLRYFNAAGADPSVELGEWHEPETHLIPLALDAALGLRELCVFGQDYATPDGTCLRDYVHVSDLAEAHVLALKYLLEQDAPACLVCNLGSEHGYSVRQVIETVARITGREVPHREAPRRPGDPACLVAGAGLAREALGWRPLYGDLETIVAHAWAWHQQLRAKEAPCAS